MRCPQNLWIADLPRVRDEVGILQMPFDPAPDVRAKGAYVQAAGSGVVEGIPRDRAAYSLTLIFLSNDGVEEHDGVGCQLVLRDTRERSVDPRLIAAFHRVVVDYHGHGRPLCQKQSESRQGGTLIRAKWPRPHVVNVELAEAYKRSPASSG